MKEFISILISFIFMNIAARIDSAFNNLISIDAIVATGSFFFIDLIFKSISGIGLYTYRVIRKDEWKYLWINIIFGLFTGLIVFFSKSFLIDIFELTDIQKNMLNQLLNLYVIFVVIGRFSEGFLEILRLKKAIKLYNQSLIVYYVSLISLDALVYFLTKNLILLFVATIIANIISIIYMLYKFKLEFTFPDKKSFQNVKKYGIVYALERLFSRIFLLLYGVLASRMGTENYSIYTICYAVCSNLEFITDAYQATLMIKVPEVKTYEQKYIKCMETKKEILPLIITLNFVFAFIYLFISHGSLPLSKCLPYIIFYSISIFGLYPLETYSVLCISQGKSYILLIGSMIGVVLRLLICLLFLNTDLALIVFGLVNFVDYYIRSLVYRTFLYILDKKGKLSVDKKEDKILV